MVRTVTLSQLRTFYRKHSSPLSPDRIAQRYAEVRAAVEMTADGAIRTASIMFVRALVGQIRAVTTSIHEYDHRIATLFAEQDDEDLRERPCAHRGESCW